MSKATNALTPSRRQLLAGVPAAAVVGVTPAAARASSVTPELAKKIEEWKIARSEYLRLVEIDSAATALHHSTAPEIAERIIAWPNHYADGIDRMPKEYHGHLRHCDRPCSPGSVLKYTLRPSYWRMRLARPHNFQRTAEWTENIAKAEAFEAADAASYAEAGCAAANANMEAAADAVNVLEREIEEFEAQSFADLAAIARASAVIVKAGEAIHQETWDGLIRNILAVADRQEG